MLVSADGANSKTVESRLVRASVTAGKWRSPFVEERNDVLHDECRAPPSGHDHRRGGQDGVVAPLEATPTNASSLSPAKLAQHEDKTRESTRLQVCRTYTRKLPTELRTNPPGSLKISPAIRFPNSSWRARTIAGMGL